MVLCRQWNNFCYLIPLDIYLLYYFLNHPIVNRTHSDNTNDQFWALIGNIHLGVPSPEHKKLVENVSSQFWRLNEIISENLSFLARKESEIKILFPKIYDRKPTLAKLIARLVSRSSRPWCEQSSEQGCL